MKYFTTQDEYDKIHSSFFYDFLKGEGGYHENLYMDPCKFEHYLYGLFMDYVPNFDGYDLNPVNRAQWDAIYNASSGEVREVLDELKPWVENNFLTESVFSVYGL